MALLRRLLPMICIILSSAASLAQPTFVTQRDLDLLLAQLQEPKKVSVIFIPGILGSKLRRPDGTQIWGGLNTSSEHLTYRVDQEVVPEVFDKIAIMNLIKEYKYNVYGNALTDLQDVSPDGRTELYTFAYDWRQSNLKSAKALQKWLCDKQASISGNKVIFVAHSMGGLVLKSWLAEHLSLSEACPNGASIKDWLPIYHIFYVGTPHAGAPKFMSALVSRYELLEDSAIVDQYLTSGLNKYGASFESIYELLPIVQSQKCRAERGITKQEYIYLRASSTEKRPVDIFQAKMWESLGIPKQKHLPDDEYYKNFLPAQLARAERLLCNLLGDIGDKGRATYIYGRGATENTANQYILTRWKNVREKKYIERLKYSDEDIVIDELIKTFGDGTVPEEIAKGPGGDGGLTAHMGSQSHQYLLDDPAFQSLFSGVIAAAKQGLILRAATDKDANDTVFSFMTERKALFPVRQTLSVGDAGAWSGDGQHVSRINSQLLATYGGDWRDLKYLAKTSGNTETKAEAYSQIVNDKSLPQDARLWASNNLGLLYIRRRDFNSAAKVLEPAAYEVRGSQDDVMKELAGKVLNNYGWAEVRRGNLQEAEWSFEEAVDKGYGKAKKGILQIKELKTD